MEEVLTRYRCIGDDGTPLVVVERRYIARESGPRGARRQIGARRLSLEDGAAVRYIDSTTFEVIDSGELLRRASVTGDPS